MKPNPLLLLAVLFGLATSGFSAGLSRADVTLRIDTAPGTAALQTTIDVRTGDDGATLLAAAVTNPSDHAVHLGQIVLSFPWLHTSDPDLLVAAGNTTMVWPARVFPPATTKKSPASGTYLQARHDGTYSLVAFTTWNTFWSLLTYADGRAIVTADGERRLLEPGETVRLETLRLTEGADWQGQLFDYADAIARDLHIHLKPPGHFVGWSTWDYYGRTWDSAAVLENLHALLAVEPRANLLQIDGGWWPNRGDYLASRPNLEKTGGMKALADAIRAAHLTAGIHIDGARGDSRSTIYKEHPDYFLHDQNGRTIGNLERNGGEKLQHTFFDYSNPGAVDYIRGVTHHLRHDWGYDYIKIDFLWFGLDWAIRENWLKNQPDRTVVPFDAHTTSVERLHRGLQAMRAGMGADAWFLGCSAPYGIVYGYIDSMRTAFDIWPNLDQFKDNVMANGSAFYLNGRVVHNDADYQIGRSRGDQDASLVPDKTKDAGDLSPHECELWANYVGLFGGAKINSDKLSILRPGRLALFRQAVDLPNCTRFVPLDFWAHARAAEDPFHVFLGAADDGVYLAFFNWTDSPRAYRISGYGNLAAPSHVVGDGDADSARGTLEVRVPGLHSVVYRLPAGADFDKLRTALTVD